MKKVCIVIAATLVVCSCYPLANIRVEVGDPMPSRGSSSPTFCPVRGAVRTDLGAQMIEFFREQFRGEGTFAGKTLSSWSPNFLDQVLAQRAQIKVGVDMRERLGSIVVSNGKEGITIYCAVVTSLEAGMTRIMLRQYDTMDLQASRTATLSTSSNDSYADDHEYTSTDEDQDRDPRSIRLAYMRTKREWLIACYGLAPVVQLVEID
jgi:hypothetical protein